VLVLPMVVTVASATPALAQPEMIPLELFEAAKNASHDDTAEAIEIPLGDGGIFRLDDYRGRHVVLVFWASWCAPCRAELPAIAAWSKSHPEVSVVAVNIDRSREPAERFMRSVHFDLPVAFDPNAEHLGRYGVQSMPTTLLFDRKGALAWQHTGYNKEKGFVELEQAIRSAP
jgi:thiol-disulfide isomerase/thioredoxin